MSRHANPFPWTPLNSIVLFTLVGFWHSAEPFWVLWGLMPGLGFVAFLLWKHRGQAVVQARRPSRIPDARSLASLGTYGFVCLFRLAPPQILKAVRFPAVQLRVALVPEFKPARFHHETRQAPLPDATRGPGRDLPA